MSEIEEKIEENKTKGETLKIQCTACNRSTRHLVLQSVDTSGSELIEQKFEISWADLYQIVQCQGCETISFRNLSWFSEDEDSPTERLYPKRSKNSLPTKNYFNVSSSLRRIHREIIESFNNEVYTLCAAGLRSIVEGICEDQGIIDGPITVTKKDGSSKVEQKENLQGKISGLCEKGILTRENSEILHEHRFLGNEAVHQLSQPSPEELTLAIEIIEHTLDALYEIPQKAQELKHRKAIRQKSDQTKKRSDKKAIRQKSDQTKEVHPFDADFGKGPHSDSLPKGE